MSQFAELTIGSAAPAFCLPNQAEKEVCLKDYNGKWVILYFYPKDNTSGCTTEAIDFTAKVDTFDKNNAVIVGVSPDSPKSHVNFINKHNLKITLLSDPQHQVLEAYGVWRLKKMYGREYYGVVRSTFLIDPQGRIQAIWPTVKVKGHTEAVFNKLSDLLGK